MEHYEKANDLIENGNSFYHEEKNMRNSGRDTDRIFSEKLCGGGTDEHI